LQKARFAKPTALQKKILISSLRLPQKHSKSRIFAIVLKVLGICFQEQRPKPLICFCCS